VPAYIDGAEKNDGSHAHSLSGVTRRGNPANTCSHVRPCSRDTAVPSGTADFPRQNDPQPRSAPLSRRAHSERQAEGLPGPHFQI
jgi:hypothetical protein